MSSGLWRLLLPSWRFFDDATTGIVLKVRVTTVGGVSAQWLELLSPPVRRPWHLIWNPAGNRTLAAYSLVERYLQDSVEEGLGSETSYELVRALVRTELEDLGGAPTGARVEFMVCDRLPSGDEDLVVSEAFDW
jgi:hypothetical protein